MNVIWKELGVVIGVIILHTLKKYQKHIPCGFTFKVTCVDDKFSKLVVLYRGKLQPTVSLKQFLNSMIISKKW